MTPHPNDDPYYFEPECAHCDDAGCPDCCETQPIKIEDFEEETRQGTASDLNNQFKKILTPFFNMKSPYTKVVIGNLVDAVRRIYGELPQ